MNLISPALLVLGLGTLAPRRRPVTAMPLLNGLVLSMSSASRTCGSIAACASKETSWRARCRCGACARESASARARCRSVPGTGAIGRARALSSRTRSSRPAARRRSVCLGRGGPRSRCCGPPPMVSRPMTACLYRCASPRHAQQLTGKEGRMPCLRGLQAGASGRGARCSHRAAGCGQIKDPRAIPHAAALRCPSGGPKRGSIGLRRRPGGSLRVRFAAFRRAGNTRQPVVAYVGPMPSRAGVSCRVARPWLRLR